MLADPPKPATGEPLARNRLNTGYRTRSDLAALFRDTTSAT